MSTPEAQEFWEQHYGERERVWSGRVNVRLAEVAESLAPGHALDLGCGEGADTLWLAERGWQVVAVDVSQTALQRAADDARERNLWDRIDLEHLDLSEAFPVGSFDLVSAQFLHTPVELDRPQLLRRAAGAVVRGGLLLIVDHAGPPPWASKLAHHHEFPSADEVVDSLNLDATEWERVRVEAVGREAIGPDGQIGLLIDNVIVLRRLDAG
jgi:SAM-dependent methyltransferase